MIREKSIICFNTNLISFRFNHYYWSCIIVRNIHAITQKSGKINTMKKATSLQQFGYENENSTNIKMLIDMEKEK